MATTKKSKTNIVSIDVKLSTADVKFPYYSTEETSVDFAFIINMDYIYRKYEFYARDWKILLSNLDKFPDSRIVSINNTPYHRISDIIRELEAFTMRHLIQLSEEKDTDVGKILSGDRSFDYILIDECKKHVNERKSYFENQISKAQTHLDVINKFSESSYSITNGRLIVDRKFSEELVKLKRVY